MIRFERVKLGYGRSSVLSELSFELKAGDYLGVVGPNGAGKTTLLRALMGILPPQSGRIVSLGGGRALRFGYVPQRLGVDELFPLSVSDIVMMGRFPLLGFGCRPSGADRKVVMACLERVGLSERGGSSFQMLSGGQKQRVLVARALAMEPDILILDEPTNGMDLGAEESFMELIDRLHGEAMTVVLVTHLLALVASHAKRVAILHGGLVLGEASQILTGPRLSQIYGRPVRVLEVGARRLVVTGRED